MGATVQIAIVLGMVVAVFAAFLRERLSPDVVALTALAALVATGILSTEEALGVFSNSGPITVAAMFVLSAALERTGMIEVAGQVVTRMAGSSVTFALIGFALTVMLLSAFINNTPVVAILTPVAIVLARSLQVAPSRLLIPLSFASIMGGATTLIGTSTNLLVNGIVISSGLPAISMFEVTVPGLIMGAVGITYMAIFGRWLLPDRPSPAVIDLDRSFLSEMLVPSDSTLIGKTLEEARLTPDYGVDIVDVIRGPASLRRRLGKLELEARDRIIVRSKISDVMGLRETGEVVFGSRDEQQLQPIGTEPTVLMEGIVGPQSRLIGYRIADLNFRRLYGVYILAIHRQGTELQQNFDEITLQFGDALLLEGPSEGLRRLFDRRVLVNLTEPSAPPFRRDKAPVAVGAILLVMALAAFEVMPIAALALIAAVGVVTLGCLTADEAYDAIQWRILMLIFGMLGLGLALQKTGAASLIVHALADRLEALGPFAVLVGLFLVTSVLTEMISNNAAAILLTPIAIGLAQQLGIDPRPFAMAVLFAASASFATPIGYQTNTFVYNAGGYRFSDFVRIGVPLNILMLITASLVIPWYWPFQSN